MINCQDFAMSLDDENVERRNALVFEESRELYFKVF